MSTVSRRAARRELQAAKALRVERIHRARYERSADTAPVLLPTGDTLQPEVKTRKHAPKVVTEALAQARRYMPGAIPVAIISEIGGEAIACVPLRDFARLLGLAPLVDGQLVLGRMR